VRHADACWQNATHMERIHCQSDHFGLPEGEAAWDAQISQEQLLAGHTIICPWLTGKVFLSAKPHVGNGSGAERCSTDSANHWALRLAREQTVGSGNC
jgi:hypothetical protein